MILVVAETRREARRWADREGLRPSPDLACVAANDRGKGRRFVAGDRVVLVGDVAEDLMVRLSLRTAMPDDMEFEEVEL